MNKKSWSFRTHQQRKQDESADDSLFKMKKVYLPSSLAEILQEISLKRGLPVSRLIAMAVDNELDSPVPFNYPTDLPATAYVQYAYADEAAKISKYLVDFAFGTGRDTLLLSRRDIGIDSADALLCGLRELIKEDIVEEVVPPPKTKFKYPMGYKYVRLKGLQRNQIVSKKRKLIAQLEKEVQAEEEAFKEKREPYIREDQDDTE